MDEEILLPEKVIREVSQLKELIGREDAICFAVEVFMYKKQILLN